MASLIMFGSWTITDGSCCVGELPFRGINVAASLKHKIDAFGFGKSGASPRHHRSVTKQDSAGRPTDEQPKQLSPT